MKKVFLLACAAGAAFTGFAQKSVGTRAVVSPSVSNYSFAHTATTLGKTTAVGDTIVLSNILASDTPSLYTAGSTTDSGFISGMDAYGDMGYAERYDFNGADSSMKVIGTIALFGGRFNPSSSRMVKFYTWNLGPQVATPSPTAFFSGFPNIALDSVAVPVTNLGMSNSSTVPDTAKVHYFTTPTNNLSSSFFVGCVFNYSYTALAGDTIGLFTSQIGDRSSVEYTVAGGDTIINDQSVTMYSDGSWNDNWASNFLAPYDFYIFPVVVIEGPTSVEGITKNHFTFYGNYPNPAISSTNIKFSLATNADVTITVADINGRTISTINEKGLSSGMHTLPVATDALAAGDYLVVMRTSEGDGIASKFTVIK